MLTRHTLAVMLTAALLGTAPASAQEDDWDPRARGSEADLPELATISARLKLVLERFGAAQEATRTLRADFTQVKNSDLFAEPQLSRGKIYYSKPDRFLWVHEEPHETHLLINGDIMQTWYPDLQKARRTDVARKRHRIFEYFAIGQDPLILMKHFHVQLLPTNGGDPSGSVHLEMIPRRKRVRDRLQKMEMWLDEGLYLPVRLLYIEGSGSTTEYDFTGMEPNAELPEDRFSLELPEGVEVEEVTRTRPPS